MIEQIKHFASNGWKLGETHGLSHWERVERNGIILSGQIEDVCFDADRLDLYRVGIEPCPNKMATKQGVFYAMYPHKFEMMINHMKI